MILVTGATGQLGTAVCTVRPEAIATDRTTLDLADHAVLAQAVRSLRPSAIVNCAAFTAVDAAEAEPAQAEAINAVAVGIIAAEARRLGIPFLTFSTDYVFDGTAAVPYVESSPPHPINAYGHSKLNGERVALAECPGSLVVRSSWLFSATHPNFVTTIVSRARLGPVRVVGDQTGSPTYALDLAGAALEALERGVTGILHLTNGGSTSWFELARTACRLAGVDEGRVTPITTAEYPTAAQRPRYSVLGSERRTELGLEELRHWTEALSAAIADPA